MDQPIASRLSEFNRLVLTYQDEAYTLAWYLIGDEAQAEAVMQEAVDMAFHCFLSGHADCRLLILRQVVKQCQGRNLVAYGVEEPGVLPKLRFLPDQDRLSLVLIDVLRLDYPDAACVTGWSFRKINRLLAQARRCITDQKKCKE